jgi:hypothetical protein
MRNIKKWETSAGLIKKVQYVLARSLPTIEVWEKEYAVTKQLLDEISWLRREDKRKKEQITEETMYAPIGRMRKQFRAAFIAEIVLNMKTMLNDVGLPREETFIIVVIRVYDNIASPSVSTTQC